MACTGLKHVATRHEADPWWPRPGVVLALASMAIPH